MSSGEARAPLAPASLASISLLWLMARVGLPYAAQLLTFPPPPTPP